MAEAQDFTQAMRDIDALQERIDKVFKRVNADPIYTGRKQISDAISDNVRYFDADRKADIAEVFFALLDEIYARIVNQDAKDPFCNPQIAATGDVPHLPEVEMLMRVMMPLSWALGAKWDPPELKNTICVYFQSWTEEEAGVIYDVLVFLFGLFPEYKADIRVQEFLEFWEKMAHEKESLPLEDDTAKSKLLTVLLEKKKQSDSARTRGASKA